MSNAGLHTSYAECAFSEPPTLLHVQLTVCRPSASRQASHELINNRIVRPKFISFFTVHHLIPVAEHKKIRFMIFVDVQIAANLSWYELACVAYLVF